jgi:hypothetical protein
LFDAAADENEVPSPPAVERTIRRSFAFDEWDDERTSVTGASEALTSSLEKTDRFIMDEELRNHRFVGIPMHHQQHQHYQPSSPAQPYQTVPRSTVTPLDTYMTVAPLDDSIPNPLSNEWQCDSIFRHSTTYRWTTSRLNEDEDNHQNPYAKAIQLSPESNNLECDCNEGDSVSVASEISSSIPRYIMFHKRE